MDIKSKKSKKIIGLVSWFAGAVILIVNLFGLCLEMTCYRDFPGHVKEALSGDYQNTEEFREYILGSMSNFLEMSIAGSGQDRIGEPGEFWDEWEEAAELLDEETGMAGDVYEFPSTMYYDYYGGEFDGYDVVYGGWSMTKEEAEELIDSIPEIDELWVSNDKLREEKYKETMKSCECRDWIKIIKTLYLRKQERIAQGKKTTAMDDRYLRLAEENLYSELSLALGIPKDGMEEYITKRMTAMGVK